MKKYFYDINYVYHVEVRNFRLIEIFFRLLSSYFVTFMTRN